MVGNFKDCDIDELLELTTFISDVPAKQYILKELLNRKDKKEVIQILFKYFLINTNSDVLEIIVDKKYKDVFDDLIKQNFKSIIKACLDNNIVNCLEKFTDRYFNFLLDNFDMLLHDKRFSKNLMCFLKSIYEKKILYKYKDKILDKFLYYINKGESNLVLFDYLVIDFFIYLKEMPNDYINKNIDKFKKIITELIDKIDVNRLEPTDNEPSFILNTITKKAKENEKINDILNSNFDFVITCFTLLNKDELQKVDLFNFYKEMIKDLLRMENKELNDVTYFNGAFSNVAIIGDKVLKTGEKNTYEILYNKRFLQPIIRRYISSKRKCRGGYYENHECVEVYERVDTNDITKEDCYLVFKELLEAGMLWADAAPRNLGRLLKPNKIYLEDAYSLEKQEKSEYYVDDELVGITRGKNKEVLQKGDIVITDLDEIYDVKDINLKELINKNIETIDAYEIDKFIRIHCGIDPTVDYLNYMKLYINELKNKKQSKKM